jgi:hypothetical protein
MTHGRDIQPHQLLEWLNAWWESPEWRARQEPLYSPDIAQMLRGVAAMIEGDTERRLDRARDMRAERHGGECGCPKCRRRDGWKKGQRGTET